MSLSDIVEYLFVVGKPLLCQNNLRLYVARVCEVSYRRPLLVPYFHLEQLLRVALVIVD